MDGHAHGNENTDPSNSAWTGFSSSDCHNDSDAHCMARAAARNLRATHRAARCARGTINRHQPAWPHRHGNADPGHSTDPNTHRNHRTDNNCPSQPHTQAANHTAGEPHATAHSHTRATDHATAYSPARATDHAAAHPHARATDHTTAHSHAQASANSAAATDYPAH